MKYRFSSQLSERQFWVTKRFTTYWYAVFKSLRQIKLSLEQSLPASLAVRAGVIFLSIHTMMHHQPRLKFWLPSWGGQCSNFREKLSIGPNDLVLVALS
ncbi:hypothetical protein AB6A40_003016 [Gnathostoma spinigerum]|uniref:Uncharacterized protein n=1 Tax=Gnathostoma spinigerum TaxID=75299 RepID=A0ABD6EHZ6_9BILA